jgi:hypothetical protein
MTNYYSNEKGRSIARTVRANAEDVKDDVVADMAEGVLIILTYDRSRIPESCRAWKIILEFYDDMESAIV